MSLDEQGTVGEASAEAQTVSDARRLRALTHPVRLALSAKLVLHGPLHPGRAGESVRDGRRRRPRM
jgi:hypothetical protein